MYTVAGNKQQRKGRQMTFDATSWAKQAGDYKLKPLMKGLAAMADANGVIRASNVQIAGHSSLSPSKVRYLLAKMERDGMLLARRSGKQSSNAEHTYILMREPAKM